MLGILLMSVVPPADRLNATPAAGHRRRRASMDATQMTIAPSGVNILKVFYSRAGHLIFALVTNTFNCRCSSMNSVFSFCASVPSPSPSSSSPAMPAVAAGGAGVGGGGSSPCGTLSSSAQQVRIHCDRSKTCLLGELGVKSSYIPISLWQQVGSRLCHAQVEY
ncbi:unnamed protein product [Schistocephalus solidus]|uniref:Secreted protein n=1 Tax=Schistocephalus solidus TaxID=70667 RepID=A0A183TU00_SCHSO|nr:unnamed protein product [Schistocephalus solidus]